MTVAIVASGTATVAAAAALIGITSEMHVLTGRLQTATATVRDAESAATNLVLHSRTGDPTARQELEHAVRRALGAASSLRHSARLDPARAAVERYFAEARRPGAALDVALASAHEAIQELADEFVGVAAEAQSTVASWDRAADLLGGTIAGILLLTVTSSLWWVRKRAFRPVLSLAGAMERFGAGDQDARAAVLGPEELAGMARRFNEMAESLARRREAQAAFLAGVAHDLRNPLSALRLALGEISTPGPLPPEPRIRKTAALLHRQVERLERMLTDLVELARVEGGRLDLRLEQVDLATICAEVVSLFAGTSVRHELRLRASGEPPRVTCDPVRIEQVLVNLLSNAIKYSPAGGRVDVEIENEREGVAITVADEGIGVAPGEEQVIFEPFRRSPRAVGLPGSGLGLFAVKRIVESHGGAVRVAGNPGGGTRFTVVLPAAHPSSEVDGDHYGRLTATHH